PLPLPPIRRVVGGPARRGPKERGPALEGFRGAHPGPVGEQVFGEAAVQPARLLALASAPLASRSWRVCRRDRSAAQLNEGVGRAESRAGANEASRSPQVLSANARCAEFVTGIDQRRNLMKGSGGQKEDPARPGDGCHSPTAPREAREGAADH